MLIHSASDSQCPFPLLNKSPFDEKNKVQNISHVRIWIMFNLAPMKQFSPYSSICLEPQPVTADGFVQAPS